MPMKFTPALPPTKPKQRQVSRTTQGVLSGRDSRDLVSMAGQRGSWEDGVESKEGQKGVVIACAAQPLPLKYQASFYGQGYCDIQAIFLD